MYLVFSAEYLAKKSPEVGAPNWVFLEWGHQNRHRTAHVGPSQGNMISHIFFMISQIFFFSLFETARSSLKGLFLFKNQRSSLK